MLLAASHACDNWHCAANKLEKTPNKSGDRRFIIFNEERRKPSPLR